MIVFAVNVVPALTWEKNENVKTKSKRWIFLSPVIKGIIIGIIIGPVIGIRYSYYPDIILYDAVNVIPYYAYLGTICGAIIGMIQILVHFSRRVLEKKKHPISLLY